MNELAYTIKEQITLLKQKCMLFKNEKEAYQNLDNIGYYRLKGYWWDMQRNNVKHDFEPNTYFEDVIERYQFDRLLKLILFDAIERIEIAVRAKMIYHLSIQYGGFWYLNPLLFEPAEYTKEGITKTTHLHTLDELKKEYERSQKILIGNVRNQFIEQKLEAWKLLEAASMGTLSKLYKSLKNQLPQKSIIANEMGLNLFTELSSWVETITIIRNIIAHHSRLWNRNIPKRPILQLNNPSGKWLSQQIQLTQTNKPFTVISCMMYLCNHLNTCDNIKQKIINLIYLYPNINLCKYGFPNDWKNEPLWK
jgi:abortive infection bacteriophage resistance protein